MRSQPAAVMRAYTSGSFVFGGDGAHDTVAGLADDAVLEPAHSVETAHAGAILVPDTAAHSLSLIDTPESAMGLPMLTANQVTIWEDLRLQGASRVVPGLGTLFT